MNRCYTSVVVLCEDLRQGNFVRLFLISRGIDRGRINVKPCPKGRQSGEQFVRQHYAAEVRAIRSRPFLRLGLVVVIDADNRSVPDRIRQLSEELISSKLDKFSGDEPIAHVVPKRNVETWVHRLRGEPVNEFDDYKQRVKDQNIRPAAEALGDRCPGHLTADDPPSLHLGCQELTRLLKIQQQ